MTSPSDGLVRGPAAEPPRLVLIYQNVAMPFVFEAADALGVQITLVHAPEVAPPANLPAVRHMLALDIFGQPSQARQVLAEVHREQPFHGAMTLQDSAVTFTAELAEALGLTGIAPDVAAAARDKRVMRRVWAQAGLHVPAFAALGDDDPVAEACEHLRFPLVVKPANGYSSQGVVRVDDREGLDEAVGLVRAVNRESLARLVRTNGEPMHGVVVEEFIDGPEYAVEAFAVDGDVRVLSIGYKGNPAGPYFEEGVYLAPPPLDDDVRDAVVAEVCAGIAALGLRDGPVHVELRLKDATTPYLLELGARIGGSGVSHFIVQESTGIDFAGISIELALGRDVAVPADVRAIAVAGNYIVPLEGHGVLRDVAGLDDVADMPGCRRIIRLLAPGCVVHAVPRFSGYPAFVLSRHDSYEEGEAFHRMLRDEVAVRWS